MSSSCFNHSHRSSSLFNFCLLTGFSHCFVLVCHMLLHESQKRNQLLSSQSLCNPFCIWKQDNFYKILITCFPPPMASYHIYNQIPITSLPLSHTLSYTWPYPFHTWHPPATVTFLLFRHASLLHPRLHIGCFFCLRCTSNQLFICLASQFTWQQLREAFLEHSSLRQLYSIRHIMLWDGVSFRLKRKKVKVK